MDELDELFNEAHKGYLSITETQLSSNSPEYQQQVRQALQAINSVSDLISQEQIFSSNEELDDIRTDYMKFLLVPYYEAELQLCIVDKERLDHLNSAKLYYLHFLRHCEKLSLVHKDDLKSLYSENRDNPTALRALLIDRIKREKEAKLKLAAFQKERAASATVDEELERNCWLAMTSCAVPNAVRQLESTEKEIKMLESVADMPKRDVRDSRGNQITPSSNSNNNNFNYNNNNNNNDKPIAYTILPGGRRVELKRQVFQPGFNMATITPEEAYEAEVKAGRMVTGGGKASEPDPDKEGEDEDDDIDNEAKLQKARYWDNFKDDNPFGSGNSRRG